VVVFRSLFQALRKIIFDRIEVYTSIIAMQTEKISSEDYKKAIKESIDLPITEFPMRGNGPVREPEFQKLWEELDIYKQGLRIREDEGAKRFILHDGPPYLSSDKIHIGTALNKILKDIICRFRYQQVFKVPFIPGYDSHGLPIENAVVKEIKGGRNAVSIVELREKCKEFALKNLKGQETKFKRLGINADWENPYVTLDPKYEAEQIKLFSEMAEKGYIYRGLKCVHWSYGCQTALADAEIEYEEHTSDSIYVKFQINNSSIHENTSFVIWTTTPWTMPANLAICLNADIDYCIVNSSEFGKLIIAKDLFEDFKTKTELTDLEIITEGLKGSDLEGIKTKHPLYNRESPIILGDHVSTETGTGCVHTAPGHGQEDFEVGKKYNLGVLCPVDPKGAFTKEAGEVKIENGETVILEGLHIAKEANPTIISALKAATALIKHSKFKHSYPYCWRSKTPLLFRATEQWFASIDSFREKALSEIDKVKWFPARARNRIYSMVEGRGDWCISRQRTWGVPIPVFYDKSIIEANGNFKVILDFEIIEHVAKIFAAEGSSAWYAKEIIELIPSHLSSGANPKYKVENLSKETDTMDVWFDSGSSHRSVVNLREELKCTEFEPVDLYLEGSDQHRGWFQSSLLTSVAVNNIRPYDSVLTHGFVMDEQGRKMSKSLGNVVDPDEIMQEYGADVLRLWVASVDYSVDIKVGKNIFKQLSEIYRNFRNTSRFMLGNLFDFNPAEDSVPYAELHDLDKLILHKLQELTLKITEAFNSYEFVKFYQLIQNFCSVDLSAFYFDICKDRLYTHGKKSASRRAAQTVILEILSSLNRFFVPILPHLAEDIYQHTPEKIKEHYLNSAGLNGSFFSPKITTSKSIQLSNWPLVNNTYLNPELGKKWEEILSIRELANKELEELKANKTISKSLEAELIIELPKAKLDEYESILEDIKACFIVSELNFKEANEIKVTAKPFENSVKCERCWKHFRIEEVNTEHICKVCDAAIQEHLDHA
jgi:isoleucyl-tRNA synthetase